MPANRKFGTQPRMVFSESDFAGCMEGESMRTLWVGGLVLALGWLSVTAGNSEPEAQPTPVAAPASEPAKPALLDGVALGETIGVTLIQPRVEPPTIAVSATPARAKAGTVASFR